MISFLEFFLEETDQMIRPQLYVERSLCVSPGSNEAVGSKRTKDFQHSGDQVLRCCDWDELICSRSENRSCHHVTSSTGGALARVILTRTF